MEVTAGWYMGEKILPLVDDQVVVKFVTANVHGAKMTWRREK